MTGPAIRKTLRPTGVTVLRVDGGLFFANADAVRARVRAAAQPKEVRAVVLDAETMPFIDVTAAHMVAELSEELARDGKRLLLAGDIGLVRDVLQRAAPDASELGEVYRTVDQAVEQASQQTGGES